jgi:hypothetical protein
MFLLVAVWVESYDGGFLILHHNSILILSGFGRHLFLYQTFLFYFHQRTILARAACIKGNAKKQYNFVKVPFNICNTPAQNLNAKQVFMLVNKTTGLKSTHMDSFIHSTPNKRMDTFPLLLLKYCIIYFLLIPVSYVSTAFLCVPIQTYFIQVLE